MCFFEIRKIEPFPGSPFSDHFWRLFFEKFCIALFLGKILVANYRIVCEVNFAPKAQNFSTDIRKSAVLDAVLEDKPAQPLPCGSYLVSTYNRIVSTDHTLVRSSFISNFISGFCESAEMVGQRVALEH